MAGRDVVGRFVEAMRSCEVEGNVEPLAGLFADGAEIANAATHRAFRGPDGARQFFREYRGSFGDVESSYRCVVADDGHAALEWSTTARSRDGREVHYDGVTILELEGDRIRRFHAYFDPNRLGLQLYAELHA